MFKKPDNKFLIYLAGLIIFCLLVFLISFSIIKANSPDSPYPPPARTNIRVCIDPPYPNISNPRQPIFSWRTSGNPQVGYWLQVDNNSNFSSPEINRNDASGNKSYQTPADYLARKTTYWYRIAVRDAYGWTGWTGCNSFYLPGIRPNPPSNLRVSQPDYCRSGPAGIFSWRFTDPDPGDRQSAYQVQVDNNSNFSSPEDDSGKVMSSSNSYATPLGKLSYNTTYYWRVRVWDTDDFVSGWSSGARFTTPKHAYPTINFSWAPEKPSAKEVVQFIDESTVHGGTTKSFWYWAFQDGNPSSSSEQNATTTFTSAGSKTVTLRVTDSDGFTCTGQRTVDVQLPLPEWKEITPF